MIGRPEIQRLARAGGVDERTQERDYVLTWLLAGTAHEDMGLVFKGGTCLRRCYIRDYRYSEDLDFTLPESAEEIVGAIVHRPLLSEYSDLPDGKYEVPSYALSEIWAEKVRSLMQRAEPRDAYDLAALADLDKHLPGEARAVFERKARAKGLDPADLDGRLDAREKTLARNWEARLGDQVLEVPAFEATWRQVRRVLRQVRYHDA